MVQSSRGNAAQLASSVRHFGTAFGSLLGCGMEMAGQTQDQEVRSQMVVSLKNVSMVSSKLLVAAKSVAADPSAPQCQKSAGSSCPHRNREHQPPGQCVHLGCARTEGVRQCSACHSGEELTPGLCNQCLDYGEDVQSKLLFLVLMM
ncbi:hypothetical protein MRX96_016066 [Rhipicephalus microplus]